MSNNHPHIMCILYINPPIYIKYLLNQVTNCFIGLSTISTKTNRIINTSVTKMDFTMRLHCIRKLHQKIYTCNTVIETFYNLLDHKFWAFVFGAGSL